MKLAHLFAHWCEKDDSFFGQILFFIFEKMSIVTTKSQIMSLSKPLLPERETETRKITLSEVAEAFRLPGNPFISVALAGLTVFHYIRVAASPIEAAYNAVSGEGRVVDIITRPVAGALYPAAVAVGLVAFIPAMGAVYATGGKEAMYQRRDQCNELLNKAEEYIYGRMKMPKREIQVPQ